MQMFRKWVTFFYLVKGECCRTVGKFAEKYFLAKLLHARLFCGQETAQEVVTEYKKTKVYQKDAEHHDKVLAVDCRRLQQIVRGGWQGINERHQTPLQADFIDTTVRPALRVNVGRISDTFADVVARFSACIASGEASESDLANMRLAAACVDGTLDQHPLVQGLAFQCVRKVKKMERGITTMQGRRDRGTTSREAVLIQDAGMQLSILSGSKEMMKEFGMSTVLERGLVVCFLFFIVFYFSMFFMFFFAYEYLNVLDGS